MERAEQSSRQLGWGFVGSSGIAATVASELLKEGGFRLVSATGRDAARTQAFATTYDFAQTATDIAALVADPAVDAVYITLPHSLHLQAVMQALDAGKHVLCEKPLAFSAAEAALIESHPQSKRLAIAEGFMIRHHPQWQWIEEQLREGAVGDIAHVQIHFCFQARPLVEGQRLPGQSSLLLDVGCYLVHMARTIFGREPRAASARLDNDDLGIRDIGLSAFLDFGPGCGAQILGCGAAFPASRMHILGTQGTIEIKHPIQPAADGTTSVELVKSEGRERHIFPAARQYALQFIEFEQAVIDGRQPLVSLGSASNNARVIDAIRRSDTAGGQWIDI